MVVLEVGEIVDGPRSAAPASPLIQADDEMVLRVEAAAVPAAAEAAAGPPVKVQSGTPVRISGGLPVEPGTTGSVDPSGVERFSGRVHPAHGTSRPWRPS